MQITEIRIHLLKKPEGKVRAFASVVFDGQLAIHDFRVIEGARGRFVSMPSRKDTAGAYRETVQPVNAEMDRLLQTRILRAFEDELARPENG